MISSSIRAALLGTAIALLATGVSAQWGAKPVQLQAPKRKIVKFKGEVLSMTTIQIVVRSRDKKRLIQTFTFTPEVHQKLRKIFSRGGYRQGDRVVIYHEQGRDVAVKIKGKASKPH
jgi:hypothetical protein